MAGELDLWAWTTTPWTLPSNLAVAVGADTDYAVLDVAGRRVVLGESRLHAYEPQLEGAVRVGTVRGADLVGRRYRPLFPYFADTANAFVVLAGDFVTTDDGTGVVQMAPGFGEDDQVACAAAGIEVICPVDSRTRFTSEVPDFEGLQVFEANQPVIRVLREQGVLVRSDSYVHAYPHCWRTDTPLVYRAVTSWFVEVTAIKDRLLAHNAEITWVPEHVRDGSFGKWLANARDWSISRNRYWGSPIPVWRSDDPSYPRIDVYGSLDELEADFGVRPADLHRPAIDDLTRPNPDDPTGRSTMRRVTDVLDCWFESGSMPYAQVHYPFENREWFDEHYPGDFIVEYAGQTRGWFYTLHVLATALFDRPAFKSCLAHGILLGDDGKKISKRLKNYPDPEEMFVKHGADAMRWYFLSSPVLRGGDVITEEKGITDAVRGALLPLWNAWYFFSLYANAEGRRAQIGRTDAPGTLDRYLLAKTRTLVETVSEAMDGYDLSGGLRGHRVVSRRPDQLVHPSQPGPLLGDVARGGGKGDTEAAFDTLATTLEVLCRVAAPLLPMITESVWRGLTGGSSVHLADWPDADLLPSDPDLVETMDRVRDVVSAAHSVRKARGLRARLPLRRLTVAGPDAETLRPFAGLIRDELNVKDVVFTADIDAYASRSLTVAFKVAAPRLGPATQAVARAAKQGDWELLADGRARVGPEELEAGEWEVAWTPRSASQTRTLPAREGLVVLDTEVDEELEAEGTARDIVRLVQQRRRELGLDVTDRIHLSLRAPAGVTPALERWKDWIASQTLATRFELIVDDTLVGPAEPADSPDWARAELADGTLVAIRVIRAG